MADSERQPRTRSDAGFEGKSRRPVRQPFLFLIMQATCPLRGGARFCLGAVDEVRIGRGDRRRAIPTREAGRLRLDVTVDCQFMSERHARIQRTPEGWVISDVASRNGVHINGNRAPGPVTLGSGDIITLGRTFLTIEHHAAGAMEDLDLEDVTTVPAGLATLVPSYGAALADLRTIAPTRTAVTLVGETGTGKEILARALHDLSGRKGPYAAINCAAIARTLIESELFGYVRGAFSGANRDQPGHIQAADHGTLLLDEILSAPPELQATLLRVIQEQQVIPVGARSPRSVDVRFVAATQLPLQDAVEKQGFRADLQARLQGFVFQIPPLQERTADMGILVAHTLRAHGVTEADRVTLTLTAAMSLLRYHWPLNIRELAESLIRAKTLASGDAIDETHLPKPATADDDNRLRHELLTDLRITKGSVAETARRLGRNRTLVYKWLDRLAIDPKQFRESTTDDDSPPTKRR